MKYNSQNLLLFILVSLVAGQHTTSPRFSPVPQPTSSGISCLQKVCPSDSLEPDCPSDCPSGCKYVHDQCCPQTTIAICQDGTASSSLSHLSSSVSSTISVPTITTSSLLSSSTSSTLSSPTASSTPSLGIRVQSSFYSLSSLVILIGCLLIGFS